MIEKEREIERPAAGWRTMSIKSAVGSINRLTGCHQTPKQGLFDCHHLECHKTHGGCDQLGFCQKSINVQEVVSSSRSVDCVLWIYENVQSNCLAVDRVKRDLQDRLETVVVLTEGGGDTQWPIES